MLNFLASLIGPKVKLPRDRVTRIPRRVRKAAREQIDTLQRIIDDISGLQGIADVKKSNTMPRGFYARVDDLFAAYDAYAEVVKDRLGVEAVQAGTPKGKGACYSAPFGVSGIEALVLYREIRTWKDFPQVAQRLGELGELQFNDIQEHHSGKDPEKIRLTSKAAGMGRKHFAARGEACPFLDKGRGRCRVWDKRPISCRMHNITGDAALADPRHQDHDQVQVVNIRMPVRPQVTLSQVDKRMDMSLSPFLYATLLQLLQLADGQLLLEIGEAPRRMQQDGRVVQKANRNVRHAKKYKKKKKKRRK